MEDSLDPHPKTDHLVNWRVLGRHAKRPAPWIAILVVGVVGFLLLEAYVWQPAKYSPNHEERFRFDGVYMVERGAEANFSTFVVSPWFSNPGTSRAHDLRFVVYAIESDRRIASSVASTQIGDLASKHTQNASIEFRLNNTKNYSIEILVLEGDYLIARGYGSVGWIHYYDYTSYDSTGALRTMVQDEPATLQGGDFSFEYSPR